MGVLPFQLTAEVSEKLSDFKVGRCNWLELTVESETVQLVSGGTIASEDGLQQLISQEKARSVKGVLDSICECSHSLLELQLYCSEAPQQHRGGHFPLRVLLPRGRAGAGQDDHVLLQGAVAALSVSQTSSRFNHMHVSSCCSFTGVGAGCGLGEWGQV